MRVVFLCLVSIFVSIPTWSNTCFVRGVDSSGFNVDCSGNSGGSVRMVNESLPTWGDAFNVNPASLPTEPTPFVIEGLLSKKPSSIAGADHNLSITKGTSGLGFGVLSNSDNNFYSTSLARDTGSNYTVEKETLDPTYNLGIAGNPVKNAGSFFLKPQIAYVSRINQERQTLGHGLGLSVGSSIVSFGLSYIEEPETAAVPKEETLSLNAGAALWRLSAEFALQRTNYSYAGINQNGSLIQYFYSFAFHYGSLIATAAIKKIYHLDYSIETLKMASIQYSVNKRIRSMVLYNYVPGAYTIGLQVLL